MKRYRATPWRTTWSGIALAFLLSALGATPTYAGEWTIRRTKFGDYTFRILDLEGFVDILTVYRVNEVVYTLENMSVRIKPVPLGTDFTGDGQPNAVLTTWSGGAHCCYELVILEIGEEFREVDRIYGRDSVFEVKDLDGKPGLEVLLADSNFAYWKAGFGSSPSSEVILRYEEGGYRLAPDLMRLPPMPGGELAHRAREVRHSELWDKFPKYPLPSDLWGVMLDMIYTGNMEQARPFLDSAWQTGRPGKEDFLTAFYCRLQKSSYWPELAAMNGLPSPVLVNDCPEETY